MPLALIGVLVTAAYWPGIEGAATTPRWTVLALVPLLLLFAHRIALTWAHVVGLALLAWLLVSLTWSVPLDGIDVAFQLLMIAACFALGSATDNPRPLFAGAAIGLGLSSAVALAQWFGWNGVASFGAPAGLFYNGNRLAEVAALVQIGAMVLRMWWAVPLLVPAVIIPGSRGALLALGVVVLTFAVARWRSWRPSWVWMRAPHWFWLAVATIVIAETIVLWRMTGRSVGVVERFALWQDTYSGLTWLGHGLGSFAQMFPRYATHFDLTASSPEHPHHELLWLAFEGGVGAVVLCVLLSALLWRASDDPLRYVLLGLAILSCFAMPLHDPATILVGAVVAGHVARSGHRVRDTIARRRMAYRARLAASGTHASLV